MAARFATSRDLYAAFPTAAEDVGLPADQRPSLDFLRGLADAGEWNAAVSFCAYLLPRREAVDWGCRSLRQMPWASTAKELAVLDCAETWTKAPEEAQRRAALDLGLETNGSLPATWMALAVGWSGGSIGPPEFPQLRAPPEQTARAVRTGLFIAMARCSSEQVAVAFRACIENGIKAVGD